MVFTLPFVSVGNQCYMCIAYVPLCIQSAEILTSSKSLSAQMISGMFWDQSSPCSTTVLCCSALLISTAHANHIRAIWHWCKGLTLNGCLCHGEGVSSCQRFGKCKEITLWCSYSGGFPICACVESRVQAVSPSFTLSVLPGILVVAG